MNWTDLLTQTAIVYGIVMIVNKSSLLDGVRAHGVFNSTTLDASGNMLESWVSRPWKIHALFVKLINCWICVSWWAGFILSLDHIGNFQNPVLSGLYSVGSVAFYQFFIDNFRSKS